MAFIDRHLPDLGNLATLPPTSTSNAGLNGNGTRRNHDPVTEASPIDDDDDDAALYGEDSPAHKPSIASAVSAETDARSSTLTEGSSPTKDDHASSRPGSRSGLSEESRRKVAQRIEEMKAQLREKQKAQQVAEEAKKAALQAAASEDVEEGEVDEDDVYEPAAPSEAKDPDSTNGSLAQSSASATKPKPEEDEEFMEAAKANKGDEGAEWQYDSSDGESSNTSSESSCSDDDDEESEEEYELLDPREQAKILMRDIGDGDEDGGGAPSAPLRTANEHDEKIPPKPDIIITPEMKIVRLGTVENMVEGIVVIKADTAGDYQVLEYGSALCLENRTIIGAVMDTLSRVREPRYTMGFEDPEEATKFGIAKGTPIYYVQDHSKYLFTQPLQNMKATDASNMDDEEAGEVEFSDDEKEAEYKRKMKQNKRARRDARNGTAADPAAPQPFPNQNMHPDSVQQPATKTEMNYDEDDDEMYHKLTRPENLHNMTPFNEPVENWSPHKGGRGRGRGNFRGQDRGRSDRGRGGRGRGFRDQNRGSPYGPNNESRQRNRGQNRNVHSNDRGQPTQGPQASSAQDFRSTSSASSWSGNAPSFQSQNWPQPGVQNFTAPQPNAASPPPAWSGQTAQNPAATLQTLLNLPPGSHINPAFFMQQVALFQQQLQAAQSPTQQSHPQWPTSPQQPAMPSWPTAQPPSQPQPTQFPLYGQAYTQPQPLQPQPQHQHQAQQQNQYGQANSPPAATNPNAAAHAQLYELLRNMTGGNASSQ
jgi:H/ACA ribonucleoprotein complex non-core subunit NAF1